MHSDLRKLVLQLAVRRLDLLLSVDKLSKNCSYERGLYNTNGSKLTTMKTAKSLQSKPTYTYLERRDGLPQ